jgi:hypothetical protein
VSGHVTIRDQLAALAYHVHDRGGHAQFEPGSDGLVLIVAEGGLDLPADKVTVTAGEGGLRYVWVQGGDLGPVGPIKRGSVWTTGDPDILDPVVTQIFDVLGHGGR